MEWDDLKFFLAVARAGSLADAAHGLKTSPATVGRRITSLETRLGARLFDRNQTGYTLTESGEAIRSKAEAVEEAVLSVERETLGRDLRANGTVRLATCDELATTVIAPHFGEFRRCHPNILLEVVGRLDLANLSRREADIRYAQRDQSAVTLWFVVLDGGNAACTLPNPMLRNTISNLASTIFPISTLSHGPRNAPICAAAHGFLNMHEMQLSRSRRTQGASSTVAARQVWAWPSCRVCPLIAILTLFVFSHLSR
jgi:DNA-binding transcriptional LysR family regulator